MLVILMTVVCGIYSLILKKYNKEFHNKGFVESYIVYGIAPNKDIYCNDKILGLFKYKILYLISLIMFLSSLILLLFYIISD